MAQIPNINWRFPLDVVSRGGAFAFNHTVQDAIRENIKNLVYTVPGTRVIYSDYGTDILKFLFEPRNSALKSKISNELRIKIQRFIRGVTITNISVTFNEELVLGHQYFGKITLGENAVFVVINYDIASADQNFIIPQQQVAFELNNG